MAQMELFRNQSFDFNAYQHKIRRIDQILNKNTSFGQGERFPQYFILANKYSNPGVGPGTHEIDQLS